ncbi:FxLD family lanthipeptide [Nucisporomicrobium flavum]|uniref:FxLD family lanthipeptide n=1 Tax=Nucisporomicrobium flavum TaxID=2785915 RepID=UPI0018F30567|nr:FxLD family lanthipeptide [Nucisporomicrobium flavum]
MQTTPATSSLVDDDFRLDVQVDTTPAASANRGCDTNDGCGSTCASACASR